MGRRTILETFHIRDLSEIERIIDVVRSGMDVNSVDSGGRTLLMEAAVHRADELGEILIGLGSDVNLRDNRSWTALHFACQNDDLEFATQLLRAGADIDAQDDFGNTPLIRAMMNFRGDGSLIEFLLQKGAEKNIKNNRGISPLELAETIANYDLKQFFSK